jgi:hypothetical protein
MYCDIDKEGDHILDEKWVGTASAYSECSCVSDFLTAKGRENLVLLMPADFITMALVPKLSDVACSFVILNVYMQENICLTECIKLLADGKCVILPRNIN